MKIKTRHDLVAILRGEKYYRSIYIYIYIKRGVCNDIFRDKTALNHGGGKGRESTRVISNTGCTTSIVGTANTLRVHATGEKGELLRL